MASLLPNVFHRDETLISLLPNVNRRNRTLAFLLPSVDRVKPIAFPHVLPPFQVFQAQRQKRNAL